MENWKPSKPGYISKIIKYGQVTIEVHRPILEDVERTKRQQQTVDSLGHSLRGYLNRV